MLALGESLGFSWEQKQILLWLEMTPAFYSSNMPPPSAKMTHQLGVDTRKGYDTPSAPAMTVCVLSLYGLLCHTQLACGWYQTEACPEH